MITRKTTQIKIQNYENNNFSFCANEHAQKLLSQDIELFIKYKDIRTYIYSFRSAKVLTVT